MFNLIGSAISAAGSLAGLLSNNAAARQQNAINRELLELQRALATAGMVTPRGDQIRYVPGVGWVTIPSDTLANLQAASDAAERRAYTEDELARAERNLETFRRGRLAALLANRIMQEMAARRSAEDRVTAALAEQGVAEAVENRNRLANLLGMSGIRQGTSVQAALDELSRNAQAGTRTALARARLMGPAMAAEREAALRQSDLSALSGLIGAASDAGQAFSGPSRSAESLSEMLARRVNQSADFRPGRAEFVNTNNLPLRLDQFGEAVRGFGNALNAWRKQNQSGSLFGF